jgi:hypothetical protein
VRGTAVSFMRGNVRELLANSVRCWSGPRRGAVWLAGFCMAGGYPFADVYNHPT